MTRTETTSLSEKIVRLFNEQEKEAFFQLVIEGGGQNVNGDVLRLLEYVYEMGATHERRIIDWLSGGDDR